MAVELATFGPGYGIRPVYVVQSTAQFENLAPKASSIVPNSCGTQIFTGIRSVEQASLVSRQLGKTTLEYFDSALVERAEAARSKALMGMVLGGKVAPGLTPKGLRHTMATWLREAGQDEREISDLLAQDSKVMGLHYSKNAALARKNRKTMQVWEGEYVRRAQKAKVSNPQEKQSNPDKEDKPHA
ncbi:hypothetical protein MACH17_01890 [Phaeobacter inhibens]|nr:hypothetical protein MACH17_01890 [Phaeobacter inhibens]